MSKTKIHLFKFQLMVFPLFIPAFVSGFYFSISASFVLFGAGLICASFWGKFLLSKYEIEEYMDYFGHNELNDSVNISWILGVALIVSVLVFSGVSKLA